MKFIHKDITNVLTWSENEIPVITIENKHFFNKIVFDLYEHINFGYGESFSMFNDKEQNITKEVKVVLEPFSLSIDNKDTQQHLNKLLLNKMKETYHDLDKYLKPIYKFYEETFLEVPLDIEVDPNFNHKTLSKLFSYAIHEDSETLIEKIYNYINVMVDLNLSNVFILINVKQYLTQEEYSSFINFLLYKKIQILLIENNSSVIHEVERKLIIDHDLCEII